MPSTPKLKYENNWEHDIYKVDGVVVTDITEVDIDGDLFPVIGREIEVPYSDMGHRYTARSRHYFIKVPFAAGPNGYLTVELKELNLAKVIPTKYTTRFSSS